MVQRVLALDVMRGVVMVLMTLDHASGAFNAGRLVRDAARRYEPGVALDPVQFGLRWVTHLCAPTFLFLAGVALALSVARKADAAPGAIDRDLAIRGLSIAAVDPLVISWFWGGDLVLLQVMYAIGASFLLMIPLRRLPAWGALGVGLALAVGGEALVDGVRALGDGDSALGTLLVHGGRLPGVIVAYPAVHWLGVMLLGWAAGGYLRHAPDPDTVARRALAVALVALGVFAIVRGLDGYGNMGLPRDVHTVVRWLNVSKYPPSLSYLALELGVMGVGLGGLFTWEARRSGPPPVDHPLVVVGQTALFFYIVHVPLLETAAWALDLHRAGGLGLTAVATIGALVALYPLCRAYRSLKRAHPGSVLR